MFTPVSPSLVMRLVKLPTASFQTTALVTGADEYNQGRCFLPYFIYMTSQTAMIGKRSSNLQNRVAPWLSPSKYDQFHGWLWDHWDSNSQSPDNRVDIFFSYTHLIILTFHDNCGVFVHGKNGCLDLKPCYGCTERRLLLRMSLCL